MGAGLALGVGYLYGRTQNKAFFEEQLLAEKATSEQKLLEVQAEQRSALHEAREETARFRSTIERENGERRAEVQRQERRLQQKEETFDRKIDAFEQREHKLAARERSVEKAREEAEEIKSRHLRELERIAQLTEEQAKELLLSRIENQVRAEAAQRVRQIEERAREEVDAIAREEGERAAMDANVHGLQPELLKILGRLHFRTSYGQNVLAHSVEVSILAGTIAHELGADVNVCKTAALLHDMGKAIDQEVEGPHAIVGGEIARRFGKSPKVIHAMVAHHATEAEQQTLEAAIVQAADAISAARPGARRETIDLYIKRLEALEHIANSFTGVEKSFAIQAGREVRIIVKPEEIDEFTANRLASDIAHKIEESLDYPGQIKVCVVRETRSIDYAR